MVKHHQVLINIPIRKGADSKNLLLGKKEFCEAVSSADREVGEKGRVLVRLSGTEPLLRIMVESESEDTCRVLANKVADHARKHFAG